MSLSLVATQFNKNGLPLTHYYNAKTIFTPMSKNVLKGKV